MLLAVAVWLAVLPIAGALGSFTLSGPTNYDVPPLAVGEHGLQGVVTADFNGDTDPDIAVVHEDPDKVSVLLGAAGGTFTGPTDFALFSSANPLGITLGNFNNDSDPDLVTANEGSSSGSPAGGAAILLGGTGGTFTKPMPTYTWAAGENPQDAAVGDFNGDSDPDLAIANGSVSIRPNGTVSILLGTGGPSTATFGSPTNYTTGDNPRAVATANFDGDSDLDLVVANQGSNSNSVRVLLGAGNGTFTVSTNLGACATPNSLAISDLNGDSDPDIVAVNEDCNNVSVWLGGSGSSFGSRTDFAVGVLPDELAAGDVNDDGLADVVVANQATDDITVLIGLGTGSFMPALTFPAGDGPSAVAIGQFNADSRMDLAVTNEISNNVSIYLGVQDGYARPKSATPVNFRLVPAFLGCSSGNASHGPPLEIAACSPAVGASSYLTLNAPERQAPFLGPAGSTGTLAMKVFCTDGSASPCAAAGEQIDVKIDSTITDVRCAGTTGGCTAAGGTYSGKLLLKTALRLTDRRSTPAQEPATAMDTPLQVGMQCASGACGISTSADAVIPGIALEGTRAIWQLSQVEVWDGGPDGNLNAAPAPASGVCPPACIGNGGETLFMHQGFFVP
jgi:hypothetical protein